MRAGDIPSMTTGEALGGFKPQPCRLTMSQHEATVLYRLLVRHHVMAEERGIEALSELERCLRLLAYGRKKVTEP